MLPKNGNWKLARKDHGRDKKNEGLEYVYLSELYEGNVPNGPWQLISEGGAAGHLAHPYEDDTLKFSDVKEMVRQELQAVLAEKKKVKGEDKKEKIDENEEVSESLLADAAPILATLLGVGGTLAAAIVSDLRKAKTPEEKKQVLQSISNQISKSKGY